MADKEEVEAELFAAIVAEIKQYQGNDPLLPWIRGIRSLRKALPVSILNQKLPRFLQKCVQAFQDDRRYRNDARYLEVCVRLMDYLDEPKELLKTMQLHKIGAKKTLFYQAFALYYEKRKKYNDAEQMYQLGIQNHAVPADELLKSYEQFLARKEAHMLKAIRKQRKGNTLVGKKELTDGHQEEIIFPNNANGRDELFTYDGNISEKDGKTEARTFHEVASVSCRDTVPELHEKERLDASGPEFCSQSTDPIFRERDAVGIKIGGGSRDLLESRCGSKFSSNSSRKANANPSTTAVLSVAHKRDGVSSCSRPNLSVKVQRAVEDVPVLSMEDNVSQERNQSSFCNDNTVVITKFVGSAIVSETDAESDARHHGLVEPTINTKEVMEDINSMFREPLEVPLRSRKSKQHHGMESDVGRQNGIDIFIDDDEEQDYQPILLLRAGLNEQNHARRRDLENQKSRETSPVKILEILADDDKSDEVELDDQDGHQTAYREIIKTRIQKSYDPLAMPSEGMPVVGEDEPQSLSSERNLHSSTSGDDTVVFRFIGNTVSGEPKMENACHHGLLDPTVNLKEAMSDINGMFREPLDSVRINRRKDKSMLKEMQIQASSLAIFADDDDSQAENVSFQSSSTHECDLFEPTVMTKEVMAEINDMFGRNLDF